MKKLILTATVVVGATMAAYSQGNVLFNDEATAGYVILDSAGHLSSSTAQYVASSDFTAQLWALPGNSSSLTGVDSYGYINPTAFAGLGFNLIATTLGGSANGVSFGGGDGYFDGGTAVISGTAGNDNGLVKDVLAIVCWQGHAQANLAAAIAANDAVGIFAFINPIGAGGTDPIIPQLTGWPTTLSPANVANDGYPELIMSPVPEPATFAMMGLGGLSLLLFRRRK